MKNLPITAQMLEKIVAAAGGPIDINSILVFETIAQDTLPLRKPGSIFNGGKFAQTTLHEMDAFVRAGNSIPVQLDHLTDTTDTVGRIFDTAIVDGQLRAQFYIPKTKSAAKDVDDGLIDSVSTGSQAKHILCSECSWDYRGDDASFLNFYEQTCGNGHTIGVDGAHVILSGLDSWFEMSLVMRGADRSAKIVSRAKAMINQESLQKLAASGVPAEALILVATTKGENPVNELMKRIEEQAAEIATLKASLTAKETEVTDLTTKLTAADAKVVELTASLSTAETAKTDSETKLATLTTEHEETVTFLKDQTKKALIATGKPAGDDQIPGDSKALIAKLGETKLNLANVPANGATRSATELNADATPSLAAFKTRSN